LRCPGEAEDFVLRLCVANDVRVADIHVVEKRTSSAERCGAEDLIECLCICLDEVQAVANDPIHYVDGAPADNYVVRVALDYVDADAKAESFASIRPSIRPRSGKVEKRKSGKAE
jgi:hypothetical protein